MPDILTVCCTSLVQAGPSPSCCCFCHDVWTLVSFWLLSATVATWPLCCSSVFFETVPSMSASSADAATASHGLVGRYWVTNWFTDTMHHSLDLLTSTEPL